MNPIALTKTAVIKLFSHFGYSLARDLTPPSVRILDVFPLIIKAYRAKRPGEFRFVQIGANDGVKYDPLVSLIDADWRGIFVEPNPAPFEALRTRLAQTYRNHRFICVRAAVCDKDGEIELHCPVGASEFASQNPDACRIAKERTKKFNQTETITCQAVTLSTLFSRYDFCRVDLLQVDTEGSDFRIMTQLLTHTLVRPPIIQYESTLMSKDEEVGLRKLLSREGYSLISVGGDTIAALPFPA